jgi:STAS domain-containing protein
MAMERYKLRSIGEHGVVTVPTEIDVTNTDEIRQALLSAADHDLAVLIIDMSGTTFAIRPGCKRLSPPTGRPQRPGPSFGWSPPQSCAYSHSPASTS